MLKRILPVLILLVIVVAAPLVLRRDTQVAEASNSQDRLVIITPHNDSIRNEFGEAFAEHWREETGRTIYIDWRAPGGGGDILRIIDGSFAASDSLGKDGTELDVFFGGGTKDFIKQASLGHLAEIEVFDTHPEWFGEDKLPAGFSGETYYDAEHRWVGVCVSQFGIVYNRDVLEWMGIAPPQDWSDLGDPLYFGKLALADPTKSSSVTQAFEMLVQEQMQNVIREKGDSPETRAEGWRLGMNLLQRFAANARYFTDSASKIPHDVAMGNAAAGTCIDFYGRSFEDAVRDDDGTSRVRWISPEGGTSLNVDSIAIFRGAPHMEIAQEFVVFCLSERGQLLWNKKPGSPDGPKERALRRLPVRRDFYTAKGMKDFTDPDALPYERTGQFVYQPELTSSAFNTLRVIFRAMCMDPHDEMKVAWKKLAVDGDGDLSVFYDVSAVNYERVMNDLVPLVKGGDAIELTRTMTAISKQFRDNYREAAEGKGTSTMKRSNAIMVTVAVSLLFAFFFIYPALSVVKEAFQSKDGLTLDFVREVFRNPVYVEGLRNALMLGIVSTLASFVIAFPLALISHRYDFVGRKALGILILIPLVLPPFVGAIGVTHILGVTGSLNALLMDLGLMESTGRIDWLAKGRFWGIVAMNALHLYPILYMNIAASLANLDPAMEQAAENLGCSPRRRLFRITLPLAMPGIFAGGSIVFIWSFTELGVPLVFNYSRVAPVQVFDGIKDLGGNPAPYALVAVILVISTLVFGMTKLAFGRNRSSAQPRPKGRDSEIRLHGMKSLGAAMVFAGVFIVASIPHLGVVLLSLSEDWYDTIAPLHLTMRHFGEALGDPLVVPSIENSLLYASVATLIAVIVGLAIAWVVVRSDIKGRSLLDALVMLPLAVPGLVMAFGYLTLSREGQPLHFLVGAGGSPAMLLIVAYAVRRLPYVVRAAVAGLQQSNPAMEEAARSLGAGPWRTLRRISIPLIGANVAAGAILAFAFAMLEVSDSLILAQQARHYPITKAIYTLLSTLGNGHELAAALGVWAMVFLGIAIAGAASIGGKKGGLFKM